MNQEIKYQALVLASTYNSGDKVETPADVVKRAETYYQFLIETEATE